MVSQIISKYVKNISAEFFLLFVVINETRYGRHNYFWYYRPSIIDPFSLNKKMNICHL